MSTSYAVVTSLGACIVAAGLEGICAGTEVKSFFANLKSPAYSPPLWLWYIIGGLYYATFFMVLIRVLTSDGNSALMNTTLALVATMMVANALWNYLFFRAHKLLASVVVTFLAPVLDVSLFICLFRLDQIAAWLLVPYLLYRLYSLWWAYGLWKLNRVPW
ncbi:MAG TPA: TspO/MBR family protein [Pyrinomonadaceae bacterium]|nr:TspO/MBR family protein [Pyrinomonadaceae bacterium]